MFGTVDCQSTCRRWKLALAALLLAPAAGFAAGGLAGGPVQTYFVPVDEAHVLTQAAAINLAASAPPDSITVHTVISLSSTSDGTVICYDHWEDGYEADLSNPVQASTQIINLDAGQFSVLENDVVANPRDPNIILFDARDRIGTSNQIAVTRGGWRLEEGTLLAGAVEVFPTLDWGTQFESPVGEDLGSPTFELVAASVSAGELGAVLEVDLDGDGTADEVRRLGPGANTLIEGVVVGTSFVSSDLVQVHLLTGDRNSGFAGRWYSLVPTEQWSDSYYNPVGTPATGRNTVVTLYNPGASAITVTHETLSRTIATQTVENTTNGAISFAATPCANPLVRNFNVATSFDVFDVRLGFVANHNNRGDIQVTLQSPSGTRVVAMASSGDGDNNYDIRLTNATAGGLDDGNADNTAAPFYERDAAPSNPLLTFDGEPALGTWRLEVCDAVSATDGTFLRAQLQLDEVTSETTVTGTVSVPAGGVTFFTMPLDSGAHFFTAGGEPFIPLTAVDFDNTSGDWGFTLLPQENLTTTLVVGWAPGRDPTSTVNPTENGSPIWVTATAATDLYVDFDGDPTTGALIDLEGNRYDRLVTIGTLESVRLFDPDGDQSGTRIYTLDGTLITAAWGQDPATASAAQPALDLGTTVLPIPRLRVVKEGLLFDDLDGDGGIDPGETIRYTITITNVSDAIVPSAVLEDTGLDPNVDYVPGSTEVDGVSIADDAVGATLFPLDEGGLDLGSMGIDRVIVITFDVTVDNPLPPGVDELANLVEVRAGPEVESDTADVPVGDPELLISKVSDAVGDVVSGQIITYTIGVTNSGGVPHRGIKILDSLPAGAVYVVETTQASGFVPVTVTSSYDQTTTGTISGATPCTTPLVRNFTVTDTFALNDVDLGFRATHTWRGDIQATLQSPAGTRIVVIAGSGGDNNDNYDVLLADGSPGVLNDGNVDNTAAPFYDRSVRPSSLLAGFNGEAALGTWRLEICDIFTGADNGTFLSAQLRVSGESQAATTKSNAAGAPLPLIDGDPTNLVLAPDAFELQPAQVMTVTYRVQVADPLDINTTAIVNTAFATSIQQPFPVVAMVVDPVGRGGMIGDRVWLDVDVDGVQDVGEPGLANVLVELFDPGPNGVPGGGDDVSIGTALTDTRGNYLFGFLPPGDYFVAVDDTTLSSGLATSPGTSDPSAVVTMVGEAEILTVDFGYTNADLNTGIVGNFVWSDADADGVQDLGEIGIGDVTVELVDIGGSVVATIVTGADGSYYFVGVAPGKYTVRIVAAELGPGGDLDGYTATVGPQSEGGTVSDPVTVSAGSVVLDVDFGFSNPASTFSIADVFWLDLDGDGVFDGGEQPIEDVTVNLLDTGGMVIASAISGADGTFSFAGLPPGDYTLEVADNAGVLIGFGGTTPPAAARSLALTIVDAHLSGVNFGYNAIGTLGDRIWNDSDGDGVQDFSEGGLPGVTVELLDRGGAVIATTVTNAAGKYLFKGLAPDQYTVRVEASTLAAGFSLTGDPDAAPDGESSVTLELGASDLSRDFGYRNAALPDLSGTVFEDFDVDGLEDVGETGIGGVVLALRRTFAVIDGAIDVDGNGVVDAADAGVVDGVTVIDGRPDLDGDGSLTNADDGFFKGFMVIDGFLDMDGDGSTAAPDRPLDDGQVVCTPTARTITDAAGDYTFADLLEGEYLVSVTDSAGVLADFRLTSGLDTLPVTIALTPVTDIDFGYIRDSGTAQIGDALWLDANRDGLQGSGEPGVAGVIVRLFAAGPDGVVGGGDDSLVAQTTTDANGGYVFSGLEPGNYYVDPDESTLPAGYAETTYPGATNPSAVIPLTEGERFGDADFGYVPSAGSAIGDTVWLDADGDGFEDPGEIGIAGVDIEISGPGGTVTVTTDARGNWLAPGLVPGQYFVTVQTSTLPLGTTPVPTNADVTYTINVVAGADSYYLDWGFNNLNLGSIGDRLWRDADGDGIQDPGEGGITGVTVNLLDAGGTVIATTTTEAGGAYGFTGLPAADYSALVSDIGGVLAGLNKSSPPVGTIMLLAGLDFDLADFGYAPSGGAGAIGNQVFWDRDGDGVFEAGESGLQGVPIDLWLDVNGDGVITPATDNLLRRVTTNANGEYEFVGLEPASYIVSVSATAGVLGGFSHTLGAAGVDNNSQPEAYPVTLTAGAPTEETADFGYFAPAGFSISGTAFEDDDEDAIYDQPDEAPVAGIRMDLFRVVNGQAELIGDTLTDANGDYSFDGLPDGDYLVRAVTAGSKVDGWRQTTQTGSGGVQLLTLAGADSVDNDFGYFDGGIITNPVTLAYFESDGVSFTWGTETEVGNVGFNIYRHDQASDRWTRLNEQLIPSQAVDSVVPVDYHFEAVGDVGASYVLEDVDTRGRSRFHGPFDLDRSYGAPVRSQAIDWKAIRAAHGLAAKQRAATGSVTMVDLLVTEKGLQRVTYEALRDAGLDLQGVAESHIAVLQAGEPVLRHVGGTGTFGPGSTIEFLGEPVDTIYTGAAVYRVTVDQVLARPVQSQPAPTSSYRPEVYAMASRRHERQRGYSFAAPGDDPWYDTQLLAISAPVSATFPLALDHWQPGVAPVTVEVDVWGVTDWPFEGDHHVVIEINGIPRAEAVFDGLERRTLTLELDDFELAGDGTDSLRVVLPHDTGVAFDLVQVNGYTVRYPRSLVAEDGALDFTRSGRAFFVEGMPADDVVAWRQSFQGTTRLHDLEVVATGDGFLAVVPGTAQGGLAHYVVSSLGAAHTPAVRPSRRGDDLLIGDAELLIVAHGDFVDGLAPLVAARQAEGLSVRVVDIAEVFGRYAGGVFDPEAIRAYVRDARDQIGTRYLLLVGADTYDYRDDLGLGAMSFIPTLYAQTDDIVRFAPADSLFGDIDGDNVPEIAVGRLPVRTVDELASVVQKTLDYAVATPVRTAVVSADRYDRAGRYSFRRDSEVMVDLLGDAWSVERAYVDDVGLAAARSALIDGIDAGAALVSFFGHSGPTVWSFSGLLRASDAAALGNAGRPAVVTQWGCWNTYYVSPASETLGHRFLLSGDRGAAAVLGASTLTTADSERRLGSRLVAQLMTPGLRLGDAVVAAKRQLADDQGVDGLLDVIVGWTLLGDPTLRIEP